MYIMSIIRRTAYLQRGPIREYFDKQHDYI